MTKKHFERMAAIVRSILAGEWTHDCPPWAREDTQSPDYVQAVQIAEVLIMLASEDNPRFDTDRFLIACGLKAKPTKGLQCQTCGHAITSTQSRLSKARGSTALAECKDCVTATLTQARSEAYQPKTGQRCGCRRGQERDNCPACEGTGQQIDFAAIRARNGRP